MHVQRTLVIQAPLAAVWGHAADRFDRIGDWSSYVATSRPVPVEAARVRVDPELLSVGGRACTTDQGETHETFVAFDPANHTFTYEVRGGPMPAFIDRATNTWRLASAGPDATRLTMSAELTIGTWWGRLLAFPMSFMMGRVLRHNLEELKHFIEVGEPHPRKVAASRKGTPALSAR